MFFEDLQLFNKDWSSEARLFLSSVCILREELLESVRLPYPSRSALRLRHWQHRMVSTRANKMSFDEGPEHFTSFCVQHCPGCRGTATPQQLPYAHINLSASFPWQARNGTALDILCWIFRVQPRLRVQQLHSSSTWQVPHRPSQVRTQQGSAPQQSPARRIGDERHEPAGPDPGEQSPVLSSGPVPSGSASKIGNESDPWGCR